MSESRTDALVEAAEAEFMYRYEAMAAPPTKTALGIAATTSPRRPNDVTSSPRRDAMDGVTAVTQQFGSMPTDPAWHTAAAADLITCRAVLLPSAPILDDRLGAAGGRSQSTTKGTVVAMRFIAKTLTQQATWVVGKLR
jgi:hypothetical protein